MSEFLPAFSLGNAAILGNVCVLPLYPGLFVLMANRSGGGASDGFFLGPMTLPCTGPLIISA